MLFWSNNNKKKIEWGIQIAIRTKLCMRECIRLTHVFVKKCKRILRGNNLNARTGLSSRIYFVDIMDIIKKLSIIHRMSVCFNDSFYKYLTKTIYIVYILWRVTWIVYIFYLNQNPGSHCTCIDDREGGHFLTLFKQYVNLKDEHVKPKDIQWKSTFREFHFFPRTLFLLKVK